MFLDKYICHLLGHQWREIAETYYSYRVMRKKSILNRKGGSRRNHLVCSQKKKKRRAWVCNRCGEYTTKNPNRK